MAVNNTGSNPLFGFRGSTMVSPAYSSQAAEGMRDISRATSATKEEPFDFLGIASQINKGIIEPIAAEKNMADMHKAKLESQKFMVGLEGLTGADKVAEIEKRLKEEASGDYSTGWQKGSLTILETGYDQALKQQEEERQISSLNIASSVYTTDVLSEDSVWKDNPSGFVDWFSSSYNLNPSQVRDSILSGHFNHYNTLLSAATSREELQDTYNKLQEANKPFKNSLFLDSRSKKFKSVVDAFKRQTDAIMTSKAKEFGTQTVEKYNSFKGFSTDKAENFTVPWEVVEPLVSEAYGKESKSYNSEKRAYIKGYKEAQEARDFNSSFSIYAPKDWDYIKEDSYRLDAASSQVTNTVLYQLSAGNLAGANDIMTMNSPILDKVGDAIMEEFYRVSSSEDLEQLTGKLIQFKKLPGGHTNIYNSLGEERFKEVLELQAVTKYITNDILKARELIEENKSKPYIKPNKDTQIKQDKIRDELGEEGYRTYLTLMKNTGNTEAASKYFVDALSGLEYDKQDITINETYSPLVKTVNEDVLIESIKTKLEEEGFNNEEYIIYPHPDDKYEVRHKLFGNTVGFIDMSNIQDDVLDIATELPPSISSDIKNSVDLGFSNLTNALTIEPDSPLGRTIEQLAGKESGPFIDPNSPLGQGLEAVGGFTSGIINNISSSLGRTEKEIKKRVKNKYSKVNEPTEAVQAAIVNSEVVGWVEKEKAKRSKLLDLGYTLDEIVNMDEQLLEESLKNNPPRVRLQ